MDPYTPEDSLEHYPVFSRTIHELAVTMRQSGLEATLAHAGEVRGEFYHDLRYLMTKVANVMFRSHNPTDWDRGLEFMAWEAVNYPNSPLAAHIAKNACADAQTENRRDFARSCFDVAVSHLRNVTRTEGYQPNEEFIMDVNKVTDFVIQEGFSDIYIAAITEFAPLTISVATNYRRHSWDFPSYALDCSLRKIVNALRESDPETARQATALLTEQKYGQYINIITDKL